jgi:hypothetical protein
MSRTLAVGLVLFGGIAGASAQPPNARLDEAVPRDVREVQARRQEEEKRRADQTALVRQLQQLEVQERRAVQARIVRWTDDQFERWVFQQDGTASRARQRLESLLATQIENIDRACRLTDAQKKKLQLAGRGDIKRYFDRYERVKRKSQLLERDEQNFQEIQRDINPLRVTLLRGLFDEDSLLIKSLPNTLTGEQFTRYGTMARQRRASLHRASIEQAIALLQRGMPLRDAQRRELITLMTNETKPARTSSQYDCYVLLLQLGRLPEAKLKPLFGETQWEMVNRQLAQVKELEPMLRQSGQLSDEDDETDRTNAQPAAPKK